ncbi:unnamed protein product [Trypanosoma congolense IL3000]|uniref:WGS project CAEQ00000000 data, annotated contig 420 n=1 Tax=Trypanosoma congolense (strain IL3000) TaxID=1068625 RepID=F9WFR6_TRYCI|nr:unnamed protein product [Trypanosoma congolense IL3000]
MNCRVNVIVSVRHGCTRRLQVWGLPTSPTVGATCGSCLCLPRFFGYSPFDSIRRPPKGHAGSQTSCSPTSTSSVGRAGDSDDHAHISSKPWKFPETLKSGRYKHDQQPKRRYEGPKAHGVGGPDRRFFRRVKDFREVQDDDPYASVFGERLSVKRQRIKEWQRQFEEENADVELPYERTNALARLAPNWFVRYFVNMRDRGGADPVFHIIILAVGLLMTLWIMGRLFYTPPSSARPISELR